MEVLLERQEPTAKEAKEVQVVMVEVLTLGLSIPQSIIQIRMEIASQGRFLPPITISAAALGLKVKMEFNHKINSIQECSVILER